MLSVSRLKALTPLLAVAVVGVTYKSVSNTKILRQNLFIFSSCEQAVTPGSGVQLQSDPICPEEFTMADGSKYVGVLQDGQRCGEGESWDKKGHYKGTWINNVKCGLGIFTYTTGCVYEGAFANDQPNGLGKMTLRDGKVFEGEFVNGVLQGQPRTLMFPSACYHGDVLNNMPHGKGRMEYNNGSVLEGESRRDRRPGKVH